MLGRLRVPKPAEKRPTGRPPGPGWKGAGAPPALIVCVRACMVCVCVVWCVVCAWVCVCVYVPVAFSFVEDLHTSCKWLLLATI